MKFEYGVVLIFAFVFLLGGILFTVATLTDTKVTVIEHKFIDGEQYYFVDAEGNVYRMFHDMYRHRDKSTGRLKYDTYPRVRYAKIVEGRTYEITFCKYYFLCEYACSKEKEVKNGQNSNK